MAHEQTIYTTVEFYLLRYQSSAKGATESEREIDRGGGARTRKTIQRREIEQQSGKRMDFYSEKKKMEIVRKRKW